MKLINILKEIRIEVVTADKILDDWRTKYVYSSNALRYLSIFKKYGHHFDGSQISKLGPWLNSLDRPTLFKLNKELQNIEKEIKEISINPQIKPKENLEFWLDISPPYGYWINCMIIDVHDTTNYIRYAFNGNRGEGKSSITFKNWYNGINEKQIVFKEPKNNQPLEEIQINTLDGFLQKGKYYGIKDAPDDYEAKVKYLGKTTGQFEGDIYYNFMYDVIWSFDGEELKEMYKNKLIRKL